MGSGAARHAPGESTAGRAPRAAPTLVPAAGTAIFRSVHDSHPASPMHRPPSSAAVALLAACLVGLVAACGGSGPLVDPGPAGLTASAPDSFRVAMVTSEGTVDVTFHRSWAPLGVDRVWHLMRNDFYAGARFYRVEEGFVAQWGFSGDPALDSLWREHPLDD